MTAFPASRTILVFTGILQKLLISFYILSIFFYCNNDSFNLHLNSRGFFLIFIDLDLFNIHWSEKDFCNSSAFVKICYISRDTTHIYYGKGRDFLKNRFSGDSYASRYLPILVHQLDQNMLPLGIFNLFFWLPAYCG